MNCTTTIRCDQGQTLETSCYPPDVKNGVIKGEAMLGTNSSKTAFDESLMKFKQRLRTGSYPKTIIERSLSGVKFAVRSSAFKQEKG